MYWQIITADAGACRRMRDDLQALRDKSVELELKMDRVGGQQEMQQHFIPKAANRVGFLYRSLCLEVTRLTAETFGSAWQS